MNTVVLTGQLTPRGDREPTVPAGWRTMRLDVPRRRVGGRRDPGIVAVTLLVPPSLARTARQHLDRLVGVVGMLDVESDATSTGAPRVAVVAESIEGLR